MLDFNKLAEGLKNALAKETTESVDNWFQDYESESIKSYLGDGEFCQEPVIKECYYLQLAKAIKIARQENNSTECINYPLAA